MSYSEIYSLRTKHSISQIKLAEFSGFSPSTISSWELLKSQPTSDQLNILENTISSILHKKETQGIDVRKKRYRKSGKVKGEQPTQIISADDYRERMKIVKYHQTPYVKILNEIKDKKFSDKNKPRTLALFSGCGGMSLGFSWAGFDLIGHIDFDDSANSIYKANFNSSILFGKDITQITDDEILDIQNRYGKFDAIVGGPPCQGFSLAGKRNPNDERNELFQHYARIVSILRPRILVMENVRLMTSMKDSNGDFIIDRIVEEFQNLGYIISMQVINAQDFGVPQFRERVFIVGINSNYNNNRFSFPEPSFSSDNQISLLNHSTLPLITFRNAVEDLAPLESGKKSSDPLHWTISHPQHVMEWLKCVPEGRSAHENENPEMRPPSGFNTTYKRLMWDEPCSTISTNFNMISGCRNVHPISTRSLTIREAARAQSFPDSFCFFGRWSDIRRAIGNAVPPLLAYCIAKSLRTQVLDR